jgi:hypothetical protein
VSAVSLTHLSGRVDLSVRRVLQHASGKINAHGHLSIESLFLSLATHDCHLVHRKFKDARLRLGDVLVELAAVHAVIGDTCGVLTVLQLAGRLASDGAPINTQHLLVAVFLEGTNRVAAHARKAGIDLQRFVLANFRYIPKAAEVLDASDCRWPAADPGAALVLSQVLQAITGTTPLIPTPGASSRERIGQTRPGLERVDPAVPSQGMAEETARGWLRKLLPHQAKVYGAAGYVEIASTLLPARSYRIYRSGRRTDIFESGKLAARSCFHLRDSSFPETDRVIAEYFLIRGDERSYLRTANITRA